MNVSVAYQDVVRFVLTQMAALFVLVKWATTLVLRIKKHVMVLCISYYTITDLMKGTLLLILHNANVL